MARVPKQKPGCFARVFKFVGICFAVMVVATLLFGETDSTTTKTAKPTANVTATTKPTRTPRPTATPKPTATPIPPDVVAMLLTSSYAQAGFDVADIQVKDGKAVAYLGINGMAYEVEQIRKSKNQEYLDAWAETKMSMLKAASDIENAFAAQGKYYPCTLTVVDDRDLSQYTPLLIVEGSMTTYDITTDK